MQIRRSTAFLIRATVLPVWASGHAMAHHLPPGMEEVDEFATAPLAAAMAHPFTGADHWLAAVAVGLMVWAWGRKTGFQSGVLFLMAMAAGIVAGSAGFRLPLMETGLAASVILGGVVVARPRWFPEKAVPGLAALIGRGMAPPMAGRCRPALHPDFIPSASPSLPEPSFWPPVCWQHHWPGTARPCPVGPAAA